MEYMLDSITAGYQLRDCLYCHSSEDMKKEIKLPSYYYHVGITLFVCVYIHTNIYIYTYIYIHIIYIICLFETRCCYMTQAGLELAM
jgi:hypothetical protein